MGTLGVFANFIAYAVMGYPAGNMLQKYGYKENLFGGYCRRFCRCRYPDYCRID